MHGPFFAILASGLLLIAGLWPAAAAPPGPLKPCRCVRPAVRREWRDLSQKEQLHYVEAVKCLMSTPSKSNNLYPAAKSRFDDFQGMHIKVGHAMHFNVASVDDAPLRDRTEVSLWLRRNSAILGYGAIYHRIEKDNTVEKFAKSPIFDNVYGFGGSGAFIEDVSSTIEFPIKTPTEIPGRTGGGCVTAGPFANLTVPMGLGDSLEPQPHCLRRDFSPTLASTSLRDDVIGKTLASTNFWDFNRWIQGFSFSADNLTIHAGMHLSIGGQVGEAADVYSSPGDPLFYFIHGGLDRIWATWQHMDWPKRKSDIAGPDTMFAYPFNFFGDVKYKNITIDHILEYPGFSEPRTIRDVMDTAGDELCYKYE
ncbi:hypothetical protein MCOR07_009895 [Pyricularia oryzae]|nr:hypothetical protein MCOR19_011119 [Pyricularia oryzae]KAI6387332.1 hypothetical protein MCOR23_011125 [Pyricularia oryzae]KAI6395722.1 hypothetical protein MCOR20_010146 [Pyricularia oryzae]KAI6397062.1 hypothetical protein MCOR24_009082 [Pyricularia oryzae]KAI6446701.1 hypothetical protein MCOR15_010416 [Pyricularia oryzae]